LRWYDEKTNGRAVVASQRACLKDEVKAARAAVECDSAREETGRSEW